MAPQLSDFMTELVSAHFNATIVEIISDNAKPPSERLRRSTPVYRPILRGDEKAMSTCRICRYDSGCEHDTSARRYLSRYHSEPIQISPSVSLTPTGSSRWAPSSLSSNCIRDHVMVPPERSCDRWGVTRNKSDSALLSILPNRTECEATVKSFLPALEHECFVPDVIAEMVQASSRMNTLKQDQCLTAAETQGQQECLMEQVFAIPGESKRKELEGKERFIRSILDLPDEEEEQQAHDEESEALLHTPRCSATRKIFGGVQAMLGFFLLVVQIISVELLGPVFLNANQLLTTLLEALPSSEKGYDIVLPLFGVSSDAAHGTAIARNDITGSPKFTI